MRHPKDHEALDSDERSLLQHEEAHLARPSTRTAITRSLLKHTPWFVITILSLSLITTLTQPRLWTPRVPSTTTTFITSPLGLDCGTSPHEARQKNCQYDLLSTSWVPTPCFDAESISEYRPWISSPNRSHGAFPYFKDDASSHRPGERFRDEEEMSMWEGRMWTTQEEHIGHCIWMARRLHRALLRGGRVAGRMDNFEHTRHCSQMALDAVDSGGG